MATSDSTTLKQCSRKAQCTNPLGAWLPATTEYFYKHQGGLHPRCKACHNSSVREWQAQNVEKVRAIKRKSKEKHREKDNAKARDLWRNDPEYRARHYAHTESWRKRNLDKHYSYVRKYRATERWTIVNRALAGKRRKRAKGADYTADDVQKQGDSQKWLCWWCGKPIKGKYHVDHRVPLARGGSNDAGNIVITHPRCNLQKHDKMPWEFNGRLL